MTEVERYRQNIDLFRIAIKDQKIFSLSIEPDFDPVFNPELVQFKFYYAYSVVLNTESGLFRVVPSLNAEGFETIWINNESGISSEYSYSILFDSIVSEVDIYLKNDYAYGVCFQLAETKFYLFAGEIYDRADGQLDYRVQDEMILVFQDEQNATAFLSLAGCC
jgi:hypothetical protein